MARSPPRAPSDRGEWTVPGPSRRIAPRAASRRYSPIPEATMTYRGRLPRDRPRRRPAAARPPPALHHRRGALRRLRAADLSRRRRDFHRRFGVSNITRPVTELLAQLPQRLAIGHSPRHPDELAVAPRIRNCRSSGRVLHGLQDDPVGPRRRPASTGSGRYGRPNGRPGIGCERADSVSSPANIGRRPAAGVLSALPRRVDQETLSGRCAGLRSGRPGPVAVANVIRPPLSRA